MSAAKEQEEIQRLADILAAPKSFDSWPEWDEIYERGSPRLMLRAPLRVNGILESGVAARLTVQKNDWDGEIYGQLEANLLTGGSRLVRLNPIEWRPNLPHTNTKIAPPNLRFKKLLDRYHPFELNRCHGLDVLLQTRPGVAAEFPRAISSFRDYLSLCSDLWNCQDIKEIEPPPWTKTLF